jgi:hypothetical protein
MIDAPLITQAVYVAAELGIADLLKDGPRSTEELASARSVNSRNLYRVLRTLASVGIFSETEDNLFQLTPHAEYLRSDIPGSLRSWALLAGQDWFLRALGQLLHSVKAGQTAFDSVYNMGLFKYFGQNVAAGRLFDQAMTGVTQGAAEAVLEAYDFSGIDTIVDVGGGQGALIMSILKKYPEMRGILFDLPAVIQRAKASLTEEVVLARCELVAGDFFHQVPGGGDAYIMKAVIHDWDDDQALTILRNCRQAMSENGKLLLVDNVVLSGNKGAPEKVNDLLMMAFTGGINRTQPEYESLLASSGFSMSRLIAMTIPPLSVIEGLPNQVTNV